MTETRTLKAIIYRGPEADLTLPIRILKAENIRWQIEDDVSQLMRLGRGMVNPSSGWLVWLPAFNVGANSWKGVYKILDERGLLLC
ncbi:hypothetical protein D3C87_1784460 [compost metagenome]